MKSLKSRVETILFLATKPMSAKKLAHLMDSSIDEVKEVLTEIGKEWTGTRGVHLFHAGDEYQFMSSPENAALAEAYLKEELDGELTRPQLETLTVVAYRGPITRAELEQIRGVNCSVILRNLLMRGLIETDTSVDSLNPRYATTMEFLRFLGIGNVQELPNYSVLHAHERIE